MFTLVLVVCLSGNPTCFSYTPEDIYKTEAACESGYSNLRARQDKAVAEGVIPTFVETHKCINWGVPA